MHRKERAFAPVLWRRFGMALTAAPCVDTDALGTFPGENGRVGTMLDCARAGAAWRLRGPAQAVAIGSKVAFGPDPEVFLMVLREVVAGHEIVATRRTRTNSLA